MTFARNLVYAGLLGLMLMVLSLGYSHHVFFSTNTGGDISSTNDYNDMGFPLPWLRHCNAGCCDTSCSLAPNWAAVNGLSAIADYVVWFAVAIMIVLAVDYVRRAR